jgi:hypothetical protein
MRFVLVCTTSFDAFFLHGVIYLHIRGILTRFTSGFCLINLVFYCSFLLGATRKGTTHLTSHKSQMFYRVRIKSLGYFFRNIFIFLGITETKLLPDSS